MEDVSVVVACLCERLEIAGVGQAIHVGDTMLRVTDELSNERRTDEARAASDEVR